MQWETVYVWKEPVRYIFDIMLFVGETAANVLVHVFALHIRVCAWRQEAVLVCMGCSVCTGVGVSLFMRMWARVFFFFFSMLWSCLSVSVSHVCAICERIGVSNLSLQNKQLQSLFNLVINLYVPTCIKDLNKSPGCLFSFSCWLCSNQADSHQIVPVSHWSVVPNQWSPNYLH